MKGTILGTTESKHSFGYVGPSCSLRVIATDCNSQKLCQDKRQAGFVRVDRCSAEVVRLGLGQLVGLRGTLKGKDHLP